MYVALVPRERFLEEVRSSKEAPIVRALHTMTTERRRRPAMAYRYEISTEFAGDAAKLQYVELFPARPDGVVIVKDSLLEQLGREGHAVVLDQRGGAAP